jgi:hypothetical protein
MPDQVERHDRTSNLLGSHRALVKTGAVRVRWDREQLIGGKPERLVSRALRVLARVSNPVKHST